MNALVTGGGGFIGSALVHELVKRGFIVTSFSRGDYPVLRQMGVVVKRGDLSDRESVLNACEGIDIIFHVAAKAGKLRQIGDGRNMIDISSIDNVVAAHICAARAIKNNPEVSGKAYFISDGEPVLLWNVINMILRKAGLEPITKSVPVRTAIIYSILTEIFYKLFMIKQEPRLTRFLVHKLSRSHWFDINGARKLLDYNPEISNMGGLK